MIKAISALLLILFIILGPPAIVAVVVTDYIWDFIRTWAAMTVCWVIVMGSLATFIE